MYVAHCCRELRNSAIVNTAFGTPYAAFEWRYSDRVIRLIIALFGIIAVRAQTLEIPSASVDRGSANIFRIMLKSQAQKPITALQWELTIPSGLRVTTDGIVLGACG